MVAGIRQVERALGDGRKMPTPAEKKTMPVARKSLVARTPIRSGEAFDAGNLAVKRPGTGLSPVLFWDLVGCRATRSYEADEPIAEPVGENPLTEGHLRRMQLKRRQTCRVCGSPHLTPVIDLGEQYLQGAFVKAGSPPPPMTKFPMLLVRCDTDRADRGAAACCRWRIPSRPKFFMPTIGIAPA